jgi:hypothetical protein
MSQSLYFKWLTKIHHIESNYLIEELKSNFCNYQNALHTKKKAPLILNPYSKSKYNFYNNQYLKTKLKIAKYEKYHVMNTPKLLYNNVAMIVTPDDSIATTPLDTSSKSEDCNCCIGKISFSIFKLFLFQIIHLDF